MKEKKSDLTFENKKEKIEDGPFDENEKAKLKKRKWLKWILNIIDTIFTAAT